MFSIMQDSDGTIWLHRACLGCLKCVRIMRRNTDIVSIFLYLTWVFRSFVGSLLIIILHICWRHRNSAVILLLCTLKRTVLQNSSVKFYWLLYNWPCSFYVDHCTCLGSFEVIGRFSYLLLLLLVMSIAVLSHCSTPELCRGLEIQARPSPSAFRPGPFADWKSRPSPYVMWLLVRYFHWKASPKMYLSDLECGDFPRISARLKTDFQARPAGPVQSSVHCSLN